MNVTVTNGSTEKELSAKQVREILAHQFSGWPAEKLDEVCELMMIYKSDRDPEIIDAIMEIVFPDSIGPVVLDAQVNEAGAEALDRYQVSLGRRVAELRAKLGMTQEELAQKAEMRQPHLSRLENGKHTPSDLTIQRIAKALGVNPSQIDPGSNP